MCPVTVAKKTRGSSKLCNDLLPGSLSFRPPANGLTLRLCSFSIVTTPPGGLRIIFPFNFAHRTPPPPTPPGGHMNVSSLWFGVGEGFNPLWRHPTRAGALGERSPCWPRPEQHWAPCGPSLCGPPGPQPVATVSRRSTCLWGHKQFRNHLCVHIHMHEHTCMHTHRACKLLLCPQLCIFTPASLEPLRLRRKRSWLQGPLSSA